MKPGLSRILAITCSARREDSVSRKLVADLLDLVQTRGRAMDVLQRDLSGDPVLVLQSAAVAAIRTHRAQLDEERREAAALSESLILELESADLVVFGVPMYNWGIPAALKAWIDQVVRIDFSFRYGAKGPEGLLGGKPAVVILTRGGVYQTPERAPLDFQRPYLETVLRLIGLSPVFVVVEGLLMEKLAPTALLAAGKELEVLADRLLASSL